MYITYFYEHIFNVKSLIDDFQKQELSIKLLKEALKNNKLTKI